MCSSDLTRCRKPVIAAVAGLALGGGCELAMMCDLLIAADNARFGQPEVKIGTLPGAGGTQRLARAIGKAKTMDLCLTGRVMDAQEAERSGLVSRVVPADDLLETALAVAAEIAGYSQMATMINKDAVNQAFETPLRAGIEYERRLLWSSFASEDRNEGMTAFLEKRQPRWSTGNRTVNPHMPRRGYGYLFHLSGKAVNEIRSCSRRRFTPGSRVPSRRRLVKGPAPTSNAGKKHPRSADR